MKTSYLALAILFFVSCQRSKNNSSQVADLQQEIDSEPDCIIIIDSLKSPYKEFVNEYKTATEKTTSLDSLKKHGMIWNSRLDQLVKSQVVADRNKVHEHYQGNKAK